MSLSVGHPRGTHSRYVIICCLIPLGICGAKNNSRRITYGIGCVRGMPFLSPLSSLECNVWSSTFERDASTFVFHCGMKRWLWTLKVKNAGRDNHNDIDAQFVQIQSNLPLTATSLLHNCTPESTPLYMKTRPYRAFSHDVTSFIWLYQNNKAAAMLVFQTNPFGIEFCFYEKPFFCSNKFAADHVNKKALQIWHSL